MLLAPLLLLAISTQALLAEDVEAYHEQLQWQTTKMLPPRHSHAAVVAEMPFKHLLRD